MAKSIAKSCPLCLSVNDPVDMLPVTMEHSTPPQTAPLYLCRLCVIQIMKSTLQSDVVDPSEVLGEISEPTGSSATDVTSDERAQSTGEPVDASVVTLSQSPTAEAEGGKAAPSANLDESDSEG